MIWKIALAASFVVANGFFVAAEFALVKLRVSEIDMVAQKSRRTARLLKSILERLDGYLSACQLGITLASLALGWIGEPLFVKLLEPLVARTGVPEHYVHYIAFPLAFTIITVLHITAGEQAPKIYSIRKHRRTAKFVLIPLVIFYRVFRPLIWVVNTISNAMLRLIGIRIDIRHGETPTEQEVRNILLESSEGGSLKLRERLIMENVMDLEEKIARRYMIPRNKVVYLDRKDSMQQKLLKASRSGHTRFPLCEGDLDQIVGIVHIKDVFKAHTMSRDLPSLADVAREAHYLPETTRLDRLLVGFQKRQSHLAVLVDEYGVVSGIITLENVLEELVGPIQDEFDDERPAVIMKGKDLFEIDATCPIDEAVRKCGLQPPDDIPPDTVGGIVVAALGRIPKAGEKIVVGSHEFTVLDAEPRMIKRLLVKKLPPEDETKQSS